MTKRNYYEELWDKGVLKPGERLFIYAANEHKK